MGISDAGPGGSALLLHGQDYGFDKVNITHDRFLDQWIRSKYDWRDIRKILYEEVAGA